MLDGQEEQACMGGKPFQLEVMSRSRAEGEFGQQLKQKSAVIWLEEPYGYLLAMGLCALA